MSFDESCEIPATVPRPSQDPCRMTVVVHTLFKVTVPYRQKPCCDVRKNTIMGKS